MRWNAGMQLSNPGAYTPEKSTLIFGASQTQGSEVRQEDYFFNYNDECFVVTDGVSALPHGDVAAKLAAETAVWGYKLVRQRKFYWEDKQKLLRRIVRSVNLAVWSKRKETGFVSGLATTLLVLITGLRNFWVASVGDSSAWLLRAGKLSKLTRDDIDQNGVLTHAVGFQRLGLVAQVATDRFIDGDTLLLASDGLTERLTVRDIEKNMQCAGVTTATVVDVVTDLLETARKKGGQDNMTACLVKKIAVSGFA